jgi:hypothetical protein
MRKRSPVFYFEDYLMSADASMDVYFQSPSEMIQKAHIMCLTNIAWPSNELSFL